MVSANKKETLIEAFVNGIKENVKDNLAGFDIGAMCDAGNSAAVKSAVEKIRANVTSAVPAGYAIPKASLYTSCSCLGDDDKISLISISLTNGWKDENKFKFARKINVDAETIETLIDFFKDAYMQLFVDTLVNENIAELNELITGCAKDAGLAYEVSLVSPLKADGKKVAYISDDAVQFTVDMNRIFDIEDLIVLQQPDEMVSEEQIAKARQTITDEIGLCQTTVQLVGAHGGSLIKHLCNIGTQVKAMTLIRKVNNKNVERLTGAKDTTAYWEKDGKYAVVARRDGHFEMILKPFDMESLVNVDIDVLATLK